MRDVDQEAQVMRKSVVVTGCAEFIGSRLSQYLLAAGCQVVGVDNLRNGPDADLKRWRLAQLSRQPEFHLIQVDIRDSAALAQALERVAAPIGA